METRARLLLLSGALAALLAGCASRPPPDESLTKEPVADVQPGDPRPSADGPTPPRVIDPEVERRTIKLPKIDSENWEIGPYFGALSIEDFGTNAVYGLRVDYHVTEDFFFEANVGRPRAGRTSV